MKQGVSAVSRNALFFRCGYSPDLLAALQGNPGQPTPFFASVATLAVLALPLIIARGAFFLLPKKGKALFGQYHASGMAYSPKQSEPSSWGSTTSRRTSGPLSSTSLMSMPTPPTMSQTASMPSFSRSQSSCPERRT